MRLPTTASWSVASAAGLVLLAVLASDVSAEHPASSSASSGTLDPARIRSSFEPHQIQSIRDLSSLALESRHPSAPTNRVSTNPRAARLGQFLFFDERLSGNKEISCASCHQPDHGFAGPNKVAKEGIAEGQRNVPTLINVGFQQWYFWDGRKDSVWSQAIGPLENPIEMGGSRLELVHLVDRDEHLRRAYNAIDAFEPLPDLSNTERFPPEGRPVSDPSTDAEKEHARAWNSMSKEDRQLVNRITANVLKCIAAYELKLTSLDTPFDRFAEGLVQNEPEKMKAISPKAREGLRLFVGRARCTNCHNDPMLSSQSGKFHNLGLAKPSWVDDKDLGRWSGLPKWKNDVFNSAGRYSDAPNGDKAYLVDLLTRKKRHKGAMKVAPLRHIEETGPYMHGGQFETLEEVVEFYDDLDQQPAVGYRSKELETLDLSEKEIDQLVAFMKTLDREGAIPKKLKRQPPSPLPGSEP